MAKTIVHLRLFKAKGADRELSYTKDGKPKNESQITSLTYNTFSWKNFISRINQNNWIESSVEKCFVDGKELEEIPFQITYDLVKATKGEAAANALEKPKDSIKSIAKSMSDEIDDKIIDSLPKKRGRKPKIQEEAE